MFSSEIDKHAIRTYQANFGETPAGDITQIDADTIPDHDVLAAGFPCQAFSTIGRRRGFQDPRGTLFFEVARILQAKRPKAFLLENVRWLLFHDGGQTLNTMLTLLRGELGYMVPPPQILNAADFGVPQRRERIFIVGFRRDLSVCNFIYPTPTDRTKRLRDILEVGPVSAKYHLSARLLAGYRKRDGTTYRRRYLTADDVADTLTANSEKCFIVGAPLADRFPTSRRVKGTLNAEGIRRLTPRERARLQGFPDTFQIVVSDTAARKQFGNAVAVPVAQAVAEALLRAIQKPVAKEKIRETSPS